ncbi:hypothetical protein PACTADRAFT_48624 [Pachysolen tannophilus NRRL Y-2460]|uniref:rRNA methyltransferase 2, mitochondrial n=1 Tax=Pachysolen tannophilus NRRL Y-2460 TaxID=669874 RepID=A0A1E4TYK5_PACTA|nr:hypothetical protein PACTADRAFT_48624 [Pachysolen tannophilus NRRL Y-2460]
MMLQINNRNLFHRSNGDIIFKAVVSAKFYSSSSSSSSASSHRWLNRANSDHYTREAKAKNYRSRAAFKLLQINEKFKIFNNKVPMNVVDLGFAPGAWSQVAHDKTNIKSIILGIDILPCKPIKGVSAMQANILSKQTHENIRKFFAEKVSSADEELINDFQSVEQKSYIETELERNVTTNENDSNIENGKYLDEKNKVVALTRQPIDVVISDMMSNTTGLAIRDHLMSMDLCDAALILAIDLLKPKGSFVCKFYTGKEDKLLEKRLSKVFSKVNRFKPDACRLESKECYFVCLDKKKNVDKIEVFKN